MPNHRAPTQLAHGLEPKSLRLEVASTSSLGTLSQTFCTGWIPLLVYNPHSTPHSPVQYIYHPSEIGVMSANSTKSRTPPLQPPVNSLGQTWPAFACGQVVVPPSAKTLELGEWFNFNDSIVSRATRLGVLEQSSWMDSVWNKMCWLPFRKHIY
jgi:hypothetical protein